MNKRFSDFNIKPDVTAFTGDKIKVDRILNTTVLIIDFKIDPSKHKPGTNVMTLHIQRGDIKHVVFTGSKILMQMIQQVPKEGFPFETVIVKNGEHLEFT